MRRTWSRAAGCPTDSTGIAEEALEVFEMNVDNYEDDEDGKRLGIEDVVYADG